MPIPQRRPASNWTGLLASLLVSAPSALVAADSLYLFSSFRDQGDGLHLAYSENGRAWRDFDHVFLKPLVGAKLFRDPHILRGPDGIFRMVWTSGLADKGIGYSTSTDLVHWTEQRFLPLMQKYPTKNCWAPELFYDENGRRYLITWSSAVEGWFTEDESPGRLNNRTYYVTTKDFTTFSDPALLIEPGFDHVDTSILAWKGKYLAFFKQGDFSSQGRPGVQHGAIADYPDGPYSLLPEPLIGVRADAGAVVNLGDELLYYVGLQSPAKFGAYASTDGLKWTDASSTVSTVAGQAQGNIFSAPPAMLAPLTKAASLPTPSPIAATSAPSAAPLPTGVPRAILEGFNADPAIRVFGDTYYIYPTADKPEWEGTEFYAWSSKNLVEWKREPLLMDVTQDLTWAKRQAWTPDCVERNGTWYFYFCAEAHIGVASGPSPVGPFRDALGRPLLEAGGAIRTKTIAPHAFIDEDGQAYLYFGSGRDFAQVVRLKPDMVTIEGAPATLSIPGFLEGMVVFKRQGKYYFMWTTTGSLSSVAYGISDSPLGPVSRPTGDPTVLRSAGRLLHVGFHSVVNVPGTDRWYIAYHRDGIPGGSASLRQVCLAPMEFNSDGTIKIASPTTTPFQPGDIGEPIVNGRGRP